MYKRIFLMSSNIRYLKMIFFSVDCKWASWGQWTTCSRTCGKGIQLRKRSFSTPAKNGGMECKGRNTARRACRKPSCHGIIYLL